ncbi:MAG: YchF/TatD family DNA exonuclease [Candidatus Omnitrophica bacterium]|nr:YchF/TatD family DNA exonuclease [Candidatus Omnitrophota bacterium]
MSSNSKIIDTHAHLDFPQFDSDRPQVIERAKKAGVEYMVNVGSSLEGSRRSVELAGISKFIYATVGIHPHDAAKVDDKVFAELELLAKGERVVGIGEIGLDYYKSKVPKGLQQEAFRRFLDLAVRLKLPAIIHNRDADDDTLTILKEFSAKGLKGVMHCFSGDEEYLKECLGLGLYVSFTCNITFKNAKRLREVCCNTPIERLMLETDCPFLAPQVVRGSRNEPANLRYLVELLAELKGLTVEDVARITTYNAKSFFSIPLTDVEALPRIAYNIRDSLYLNITNRCSNGCSFCTRGISDFVKGHNLTLEREPTFEEVIAAMGDVSAYKEIVFCGFGEPTLRLDLICQVAKYLKEKRAKVRLVTNGHGNLIHKRSIVSDLRAIIDRVSISLDVDSKEKYLKICKPQFGPGTYDNIIDFIKECKSAGLDVEVTCLDIEGVNIKKCKELAKGLGVEFRQRHLNMVG